MSNKRGTLTLLLVIFIVVVFASIALAISTPSVLGKVAALALLLAVLIAGGWYLHSEFTNIKNRLERKLGKLTVAVEKESAEILHGKYLEIHDLYLKLHEKHKPRFYNKIQKLLKRIETQFVAEKKIRELLHGIHEKKLDKQKEDYSEMQNHY